MYTPGFIFKGCIIRPSYTYGLRFLKRKNFYMVPVACGCLLVGSTPPWGPRQQYSFIVYTLKTVT